jgi:hypothetical protein
MVIGQGNVVRIAVFKMKRNPPLVVDAYAPEARLVAAQFFQPIAGRHVHLLNGRSGFKLKQPDIGPFDDAAVDAFDKGTRIQGRRLFICEAFDHGY